MRSIQAHCYYLQPGQRIIYPEGVVPCTPPVWRYSTQFLMQFKSLCVRNAFVLNIEMAASRRPAHAKSSSRDTVTPSRSVKWDIQQQRSPSLHSTSSWNIPDAPTLFASIDPVRTALDVESNLCGSDSTDSHQDNQLGVKSEVDQAWPTSTDPLPPHQQSPSALNVEATPFIPHLLDEQPTTPVIIPESTPASIGGTVAQSMQSSDAASTAPLQNPQISQPQPSISKFGRIVEQFPRGRDPSKSIWADR